VRGVSTVQHSIETKPWALESNLKRHLIVTRGDITSQTISRFR
jgi:hypothetical protein